MYILKPLSEGNLTIGVFISIGYGIMDLVNEMTCRLSLAIQEICKNIEYFMDIRKFFDLEGEEEEDILSLPINTVELQSLEFKNPSYKYPGTENYIFKNLNLKIESGEVGSNGSGKNNFN